MSEAELAELKCQLRTLERENSRLKAAIRASPAGIVIARAPDGVIEHWNPAALAIAGTSEERLAEIPLELRTTRWPTFGLDGVPIPPDERPLLRSLRSGEVIAGEEFFIQGEDAKLRRVESHAAPVLDDDGNITAAVVVFPDITARQSVEIRARRFSEMAMLSPAFVGFAASSGAVEYVNPAGLEMCGYPVDWDTSGMTFADFHPPDDAARIQNTFFTPGATADSGQMLVRLRHRDGSDIPVSMVLVVHYDSLGRRAHFSAVMEDQRPAEALQEQVARNQRLDAIGRLAGGIAHDFNNLLTVIKNYTHLAAGEVAPSSPVRDDLRLVEDATDRAATLCRQLLSFARREVIEPVALDLGPVITAQTTRFADTLSSHIQLERSVDDDLWGITADRKQLEQVLDQLMLNARDAMPEGGRISIDVANVVVDDAEPDGDVGAGEYVCVSITDTGSGISPAALEQIFEPFSKIKPDHQSSGLGLATVYGAVRQNGGYVSVRSEPESGTTFAVYWPRAEGSQIPAPAAYAQQAGGTKGPRILVAEDDDALRALTVRLLEADGYDVVSAIDGSDGLAAWSRLGYIDLLVTDVMMPNLNGRALAEELQRRQRALPVLFMSGYTHDIATEGGVLEPGVEFLSKPFSIASLRDAVKRLLPSVESVDSAH